MDINEITRVEKRGDFFFKRDDLYKPFDWSPINGSKVRQCELLIEKNISIAKNGIVTGSSILSPQASIVSAIAKNHRFPCTIMYGGTNIDSLRKKKYPSLCLEYGANVCVVSNSGFTSVLTSKADEYARKNRCLHIRYGIDLLNKIDVFINSVAKQVANIPNDIDNIVLTVGSGTTLIGVMLGMARYKPNIKNVYGVGCAPNRVDKIKSYVEKINIQMGIKIPLWKLHYIDAFNEYDGYKYSQTMKEQYNGIVFHPRYEAKTFHWLKEQRLDGNTLMWIIGSDW